jgi:hypothetical protein
MHSFTLTTLLAECLIKGFPESINSFPELQERKINPPRRKKKEIYEIKKSNL